uniref:Si:dkey-12e7.4 n=1 Tax=Neolamprologus brichardi TaxID=32507 RepID=A0A3Q4GMI7_NEOBR
MSAAVNFKKCGSVLITGASRGLGLQLVDSLASGQFSPGKIIATCRNPGNAQELQELAEKHPNIHIITLDVVNQESIEKSVEEVSKLVQEEGLNCLINNAGIKVEADFHSVTAEMMIENFHTNTVAPLMITKVFFIYILCASSWHRGRLFLTHSLLLLKNPFCNCARPNCCPDVFYNHRLALNMVSRCMAVDLEPDGILCMAIHPGWVRTDMGGSEAPLSPEDSISFMLSVIGGLTEKDHGSFLNFTGEQIPW